ncbi:MAG: hypothetical protein DPW14_03810 [Planctomycetes bacterium]|nr:hypothetical protein [Planctomycetota bacterium]
MRQMEGFGIEKLLHARLTEQVVEDLVAALKYIYHCLQLSAFACAHGLAVEQGSGVGQFRLRSPQFVSQVFLARVHVVP